MLDSSAREAGFTIQLKPWQESPDQFGAIALLKLALQWLAVGTLADAQGKPYQVCGKDAFALTCETHGVRFYRSNGHRHPVIVVPTKNGDQVYFVRVKDDKRYLDWQYWQYRYHVASFFKPEYFTCDYRYSGVIVPKVRLDRQPDISWLIGMQYADAFITQALQQVKLGMNHLGALVEACTLLGVSRGVRATREELYPLDGPFLMVVKRPRVELPIFVGLIAEDVFADPGELAF